VLTDYVKYDLINGPLDGGVAEIPDDALFWQFMVLSEMPSPWIFSEKPMPVMPIPKALYRKARLTRGGFAYLYVGS
jgi:hypothetical protein